MCNDFENYFKVKEYFKETIFILLSKKNELIQSSLAEFFLNLTPAENTSVWVKNRFVFIEFEL